MIPWLILIAPIFMVAAIAWSVYGFIKLIRISIDYEDFCELYFNEHATYKSIKRFIIKHTVGIAIGITIITLLILFVMVMIIAAPDKYDIELFFMKLSFYLRHPYRLLRPEG